MKHERSIRGKALSLSFCFCKLQSVDPTGDLGSLLKEREDAPDPGLALSPRSDGEADRGSTDCAFSKGDPMTEPVAVRLRALASEAARSAHVSASLRRPWAPDGHVFIATTDDGFETCPHPDCLVVRTGGEEPRVDVLDLDAIRKMRDCQHDNRTGGNDYILCHDCGLQWDYRRETADAGLVNYLLAEIARLRAAEQEPDYRRCGYCNVWATKPCGEQCVWSPDGETVTQAAAAAAPRRALPDSEQLTARDAHAHLDAPEQGERSGATGGATRPSSEERELYPLRPDARPGQHATVHDASPRTTREGADTVPGDTSDEAVTRLRTAGAAFLAAVSAMLSDARFQTVFTIAQAHGCPYTGPNLVAEFQAFREALDESAAVPASRGGDPEP